MKRNNMITCAGPLRITAVTHTEGLAVQATLDTDLPALGGRHHILITAERAEEILAFWRLLAKSDSAQDALEVTLHGWLYSHARQPAVVIADRITVHTSREVRQQVKALLQRPATRKRLH